MQGRPPPGVITQRWENIMLLSERAHIEYQQTTARKLASMQQSKENPSGAHPTSPMGKTVAQQQTAAGGQFYLPGVPLKRKRGRPV